MVGKLVVMFFSMTFALLTLQEDERLGSLSLTPLTKFGGENIENKKR